MTEILAYDQADAWVKLVKRVLNEDEVSPRGLRVKEFRDRVTVVVRRPDLGFPSASGRSFFGHEVGFLEGLSLVGQTSLPELETDRVKAMRPYLNGGVFRGAYGSRVEGALGDAVQVLRADPHSRQAVLSIFDSRRDLGRWSASSVSGDVPCTVAIQFLVRGETLQMWVVMRSQDLWFGTPSDLVQFSLLQAAVAHALYLPMGTYTHSVGSLHLYEQQWEKVAGIDFPSEPVVDVDVAWGGPHEIGATSQRARKILLGQVPDDPTPLEALMSRVVGPVVDPVAA